MSSRLLSIAVLVGLAAVIALLSGHFIHNDLGVPNGTIRIDAVAAAGVLTVVCALNFMKKKN
jgi:hypothetical protein